MLGVEIHSKRLSSPNIGNYTHLDIAIHPDFFVKIQKQRQRSAKPQVSFESTVSTSFDESTDDTDDTQLTLKYAEILTSAEIVDEHAEHVNSILGTKVTASTLIEDGYSSNCNDNDNIAPSSVGGSSSSVKKGTTNNQNSSSKAIFINNNNSVSSGGGGKQTPSGGTLAATAVLDAAQFIKESGILGPTSSMGNAISGLFRKHSKVIPLHHSPSQHQTQVVQEPVVNKEQVSVTLHFLRLCD